MTNPVGLNGKPIVKYRDARAELGRPAMIEPIDHPSEFVSNRAIARTTKVEVVHYKDGKLVGFQTRNTIYVKDEQ